MPYPQFPKGFLFGTATSAFQIEGGVDLDGKGPSIWDTFTHRRGKVVTGETADTACNTYADFQTDVDLMADLGLNAYRFSIAWSRVMTAGQGAVNQAGLDYYKRLVDALLKRGVRPFVTLYHWDMPQALQDRYGGFAGRGTAYAFADYAEVVVKALGDCVKDWITLNEPFEHAAFGHLLGAHAPGKHNPWTTFRVAHHQLLAHGLALERIRAISPDARAGITLSVTPILPVRDDRRTHHAAKVADQFFNSFFLDGVIKGVYPDPFWTQIRLARPKVAADDMQTISRPIDFLGINYYSREFARAAWYIAFLGAWVDEAKTGGKEALIDGMYYTASGREIYPAGLYELLKRLKTDYGNPPLYITENGAAFSDQIDTDGSVHDANRVSYLDGYFSAAERALAEGVDLRGYFIWSLIDNFEWNLGFSKRFGIVYVDHANQHRTIKDSGYWVKQMIAHQGMHE